MGTTNIVNCLEVWGLLVSLANVLRLHAERDFNHKINLEE